MAIAEQFLAATFNRDGHDIIDHYTYAIVSDGDVMEGVAMEAASIAGHLELGKLIYLYDQNHITLAGTANLSMTEDVAARFEAAGWHTVSIDGMDTDQVRKALDESRAVTDKPSLILAKTIIGFGSPKKEGTFGVHGSPLGPDEVAAAKKNLDWPEEPAFFVPDEALEVFREAVKAGAQGRKGMGRRPRRLCRRASRARRRAEARPRRRAGRRTGMPICRSGRSATKPSPPARPPKRSSRPSTPRSPPSSAVRPTSTPPPTPA